MLIGSAYLRCLSELGIWVPMHPYANDVAYVSGDELGIPAELSQ